jgi:dolichyl-phosphate-mannose--protein O-mannosyl transferase
VAPGTMNRFAHIMLIGNPVVWWASTYAILLLLINLPPQLLAWVTRRTRPESMTLFLCGAYALNLLPFMGIARVMFLYHYMSALMFAVLALCWQLDRASDRRWLMPMLLAGAVAAFIFFAPLTYGLHLSQSASDARFWVESWH